MTAAVIGANSYIARNLIAVIQKNYPDCAIKLYDHAQVQKDGAVNYERIDILDRNSVVGIDLDCDAVFMFVGKTGSANGFDDYDTFLDVNERALLNLLNEYRRQKSSAKIIFPSTRLVYKGKRGKLQEDAEKEFKTIYAINKYACEQYLRQYNDVFGVRYCIFRICVPYGTVISGASSYGTAEFMTGQARRGQNISVYGNGSVRRTLTHIEDLCNALIMGAKCPQCENDIFNVGGEDYSLMEMAQLISSRYGVGIDHVAWPEMALKIESGDTVFDDTKLRNTCGITYRHKFSEWCQE